MLILLDPLHLVEERLELLSHEPLLVQLVSELLGEGLLFLRVFFLALALLRGLPRGDSLELLDWEK